MPTQKKCRKPVDVEVSGNHAIVRKWTVVLRTLSGQTVLFPENCGFATKMAKWFC